MTADVLALIADARERAAWFKARSKLQRDHGRNIHGGDCREAAEWMERLCDELEREAARGGEKP